MVSNVKIYATLKQVTIDHKAVDHKMIKMKLKCILLKMRTMMTLLSTLTSFLLISILKFVQYDISRRFSENVCDGAKKQVKDISA